MTDVASASEATVSPAEVEKPAYAQPEKPPLVFKVVHGKNSWDITIPEDALVSDLKTKLEGLTGIHVNLQKLLWRGNLADATALNTCRLTPSSKVMMIASAVEDVLKVNMPAAVTGTAAAAAEKKEAVQRWEHMTEHKKVIAKGPPEDATAPSGTFPIPPNGITNLLNRQGGKVRLTFKTDDNTLIISTADRTQKVSYDNVKAVTSQAISEQFDGKYHILALQLGPTDKSNYYLYFCPGAYVEAIKTEVLGGWQSFF